MMALILFFCIGCLAGLASGLLGIGGGTIIVPAFSMIFYQYMDVPKSLFMHLATGTALCIMIFTCIGSVHAHLKQGSNVWPYFKSKLPFLTIGIILGANLADGLPAEQLKTLFGGFLFLMALEMFVNRGAIQDQQRCHDARYHRGDKLVFCFVGMIAAMLGIGGGILLIPYLSRSHMPIRKATCIAAMCSLTVGLVGTGAVILTGLNNTSSLPWATGYVYWPAVMSAVLPSVFFARLATSWAYVISAKWLKLAFVVFLLITSIKMLIVS